MVFIYGRPSYHSSGQLASWQSFNMRSKEYSLVVQHLIVFSKANPGVFVDGERPPCRRASISNLPWTFAWLEHLLQVSLPLPISESRREKQEILISFHNKFFLASFWLRYDVAQHSCYPRHQLHSYLRIHSIQGCLFFGFVSTRPFRDCGCSNNCK